MIRIVQFALLLAIIIPFGILVRAGVDSLTPDWRDTLFAGLVGFCLCYALWHWDTRPGRRR